MSDIKDKLVMNVAADVAIRQQIANMQKQANAMPLEFFLKGMRRSVENSACKSFIIKAALMKLYVEGLHMRGLIYHFDDCAIDCLMSEAKISLEDATLINELTDIFHCEDMFTLAIQLAEETDLDACVYLNNRNEDRLASCINCGDASPHKNCTDERLKLCDCDIKDLATWGCKCGGR